MSRFRTFATVAFAATVLAMAFNGGAAAGSHSCAAKHSTTVKVVSNVRIFSRVKSDPFVPNRKYRAIYACSRSFGKRFELRTGEFPGEDNYSKYVVADRYLAYVMSEACPTECGLTYPYVLDLKYGRTNRKTTPKYVTDGLGPECVPRGDDPCAWRYTNLVVRRTGSFAFSFRATPRSTGTATHGIQKHEFGPGLRTESMSVVDRLTNKDDLETLALDGDRLTWTNAGVAKSATIK